MRHSKPQQYLPSLNRIVANNDSIEWEELPSLIGSLAQCLVSEAERAPVVPQRTRVWDNTLPANLEAPAPTEPFQEALHGLSTRQVYEPDVFRHFFGATAQA
jgi:hypothetical protein